MPFGGAGGGSVDAADDDDSFRYGSHHGHGSQKLVTHTHWPFYGEITYFWPRNSGDFSVVDFDTLCYCVYCRDSFPGISGLLGGFDMISIYTNHTNHLTIVLIPLLRISHLVEPCRESTLNKGE